MGSSNYIFAIALMLQLTVFCDCALFFPSNSAYGIFAAIAVPLDLPHRNVFVSYNFEANYNFPVKPAIPPILNGIDSVDDIDGRNINNDHDCTNCTLASEEAATTTTTTTTQEDETSEANERQRRSLLTRAHFYHILKDKFERSGYGGEACLLRLICETNASELGDVNGVLGSLVHIMFSPSTSQFEELPLSYYQAEADGVDDQCHYYEENCQESILDLISTPIHKILEEITNKI